MKHKKYHHQRENTHTTQPHSQRQPPNPKTSGLTKRHSDSKSKENYIQITEPLDVNPQTYPSKQFVLSKDNIANCSRSSLKDINTTRNPTPPKYIQNKSRQKDTEKELFDRRLSLKCTANYSQQLQYQKSQRLSMAPLRRQPTNTIIPQSLLDERQSMSSIYQNSVCASDSKSRHTIKKQTIITNLMNKLDYEQDLRSIIELKLKNGSNVSYCNFNKDKRNQSYITDFTEDNHQGPLITKLKQCENQISYFKAVIKEMSQKIVELTEDKNSSKRKSHQNEYEVREGYKNVDSKRESMSKKRGNGCERCGKCQRMTQSIGVQTGHSESRSPLAAMNESTDFLDNLERTLNILDNRRH